MFVHHVFFWLKNPQNELERNALIAGLETLTSIPNITLSHIGLPSATNRAVIDRSYSVSWLLLFEDAAAEEVYQDHPIHHAFVENCSALWEKVVVYDAES